MENLRDQFDSVAERRQLLEVHTDRDRIASELEQQFSTRNVRIVRKPALSVKNPDFVIVRDADREFRAAVGVEHLEAMLSPEIHPPWRIGNGDDDAAERFRFLENTIFTSYDRRQLLAVSREIEERAWRTGAGAMFVGFQNTAAFRAQLPVYERLVRECDLTVTVFVENEWRGETVDGIDVVSDAASEIGAFWFVLFDGDGSDLKKCGLLAEEREEGQYYGFWTDEPERVDEMIAYLQSLRGF